MITLIIIGFQYTDYLPIEYTIYFYYSVPAFGEINSHLF
jgi:hypothetical protein